MRTNVCPFIYTDGCKNKPWLWTTRQIGCASKSDPTNKHSAKNCMRIHQKQPKCTTKTIFSYMVVLPAFQQSFLPLPADSSPNIKTASAVLYLNIERRTCRTGKSVCSHSNTDVMPKLGPMENRSFSFIHIDNCEHHLQLPEGVLVPEVVCKSCWICLRGVQCRPRMNKAWLMKEFSQHSSDVIGH